MVSRLFAAASSSSALDFANVTGSEAFAVGFAAGADSAGNSYAIGCAGTSAGFQTTPGALDAVDPEGPAPMVYLRKFSAEGSKILVSALLGGTGACDSPYPLISARVDTHGDVYVAFENVGGSVPGVASWGGDPNGYIAVLKISPQADRVLYATRVFADRTGPLSLDIDPTGSCYIALEGGDAIRLVKLDASGAPTGFAYTITDTPTGGAGTIAYDGHWLSIAAGPDGSVYVAGSPCYVYRVDPSGQKLLYRTEISKYNETLASIAVDPAGNAYVAGSIPYTNGSAPIPLNQIGFTQAYPVSTHAMLLKLDPSGNIVYQDAFENSALTAVVTDAKGNAWAAGSFSGG